MKDKITFWEETTLKKEKLIKLFNNTYPTGSTVYIKLHFGEPGNQTAFKPQDIKPIIAAFNDLNIKTILTDTPVAYNSPRSTIKGYRKSIEKQGYTDLTQCEIINNGVKVKTKDMTIKVSKNLAEAKHILVLSHVKGHECTGMGGAIKNLGMGGVTKESKELQHNLAKPKFIEKCIGCGSCVNICPANAIKMKNNEANIDLEKCSGCSLCVLHCPHEVLKTKGALFGDLLAQAAKAVISKMPKNVLYINVIKNITEHCDCYSDSGDIISKDIGILISKSATEIDRKSLDLLKKRNDEDIFNKRWKRDPLSHVKFLEKYLS